MGHVEAMSKVNGLDMCSENECWIQLNERLIDNAYRSKVLSDKKSWFTWMEVVDLIYHQFLFPANSLRH